MGRSDTSIENDYSLDGYTGYGKGGSDDAKNGKDESDKLFSDGLLEEEMRPFVDSYGRTDADVKNKNFILFETEKLPQITKTKREKKQKNQNKNVRQKNKEGDEKNKIEQKNKKDKNKKDVLFFEKRGKKVAEVESLDHVAAKDLFSLDSHTGVLTAVRVIDRERVCRGVLEPCVFKFHVVIQPLV